MPPKKRRKKNDPQWAAEGIEKILQESGRPPLDAASMARLVQGHGAFLQAVVARMAGCGNDDTVEPPHVLQALETMQLNPMIHRLKTYPETFTTEQPAIKPVRRKKKQKKEFSAEQIADQERLLAASKEKLKTG